MTISKLIYRHKLHHCMYNQASYQSLSRVCIAKRFETELAKSKPFYSQNINYGQFLPVQCKSFHTTSYLRDQPSSKVETVVETLKEKEKEKEKASLLNDPGANLVVKPVVKKTLWQKIWAELVHYYHGFRLLFIDINVCRKLLWRVLNGKTLTRREHKLLIRTTSDIFRLVPFSVFIIVPFMELLLPLAIKLFPGMLPSTFQTATEREDKMKQHLKMKLEMAKFLQKTLDEMSVKHKDHKSEAAKEFSEFFHRVRSSGSVASNEEIMKFSKLFEDEITLDSLNRQQLTALCRVLEINTLGTSAFLRFQLEMKLRNLAADDRVIKKEGLEFLNLSELQNACRARGMRAYGLSEDQLKQQLQEWIDLSLNDKVPPSLLILSRALMIPENITTSDKLKATISALPEAVVAQAKAAIGEKEGKVDNKTKIEIIKEEQRKIKEEKEELKEAEVEKRTLSDQLKESMAEPTQIINQMTTDGLIQVKSGESSKTDISAKDLEVLEDALESMSKAKRSLIVEKEELRDLKEEINDYKEDVSELLEIVEKTDTKEDIKESSAARLLFRKVNSMIDSLDNVLDVLEKKEKQLKVDVEELMEDEQKKKASEEIVRIDDLMETVKEIQKVRDDPKALQIEHFLGKIDVDHDGVIKVEDVLKILETVGKENISLKPKQIDELIDVIVKEESLETEKKILKALSKSIGKVGISSADEREKTAEINSDDTSETEKHILKPPTKVLDSVTKTKDESTMDDDIGETEKNSKQKLKLEEQIIIPSESEKLQNNISKVKKPKNQNL